MKPLNRTTEVKRVKLLEILKTNRNKHAEDYQEALDGYKTTAELAIKNKIEELRKDIDKREIEILKDLNYLSKDDIPNQQPTTTITKGAFVHLEVPSSHIKEYDTIINMIEWDVNDVVELSADEFRCFIEDDWDWKDDFVRVSNMYKSNREY